MIERNFNNDEFEQLIRGKTDQYKMYPSEKVWKGIYRSLHTKRRWFLLMMFVLSGGMLFFAGKEFLFTSSPVIAKKSNPEKVITDNIQATAQDKPVEPKPQLYPVFSAIKQNNFSNTPGENPDSAAPLATGSIAIQQVNPETAEDRNGSSVQVMPDRIPENSAFVIVNNPLETVIDNTDQQINPADLEEATDLADAKPSMIVPAESNEQGQALWLKDIAPNQLNPPPTAKSNKFNIQFYASPTMNYRRLTASDNYVNSKSNIENVPLALVHVGNPNELVDHTPAMGFEVGSSMLYRVTRNLSLKAGLQFNYIRYTIKAYSSITEPATIALNSYYGLITDSITTFSNIRNFGGNSKENIANNYYQLSIPIGFELRLMGNERLQLNIGGTIQPSYLINRNSYLLSTDYASYTNEPSLFRRWNLNGGVEAYFSYNLGNVRLQAGPQFRYQFFSTYSDKYPIRENLMEYGFKIGISKIIR